jgi:multidrug efflux pump subunit AcrA (membrane-fusion protein)
VERAKPDAEPVPGGSTTSSGSTARGPESEEILLTGELRAVRATSIVAPETAIFQMRIQFLPEEGTEVRKGDPLVDFDNTALADRVLDLETRILDAQTQIAAKRGELDSALMDLEIERSEKQYENDRARVRAEIDPEILSRKDNAERQYEYRKAQLELAEVLERAGKTRSRGEAEVDVLVIDEEKLERDLISTRHDLEVLSVKAPIDGLVVHEYREGSQTKWKEGDSVWPGQPVVTLPDLSEMEVQFQVSEVDAHRLRVGTPVRITIDSFPERGLGGTIVHIPSMAVTRDPESKVRIFRVRSTLSETWRDKMKPGMSVLGIVTVPSGEVPPVVARQAVASAPGTVQ